MTVFLVRHAHAGTRSPDERDKYRQLSDRGQLQAKDLVKNFGDRQIAAIWSSTATRCVQTVEPLAEAIGLEVAAFDELWETSPLAEGFDLIDTFFESHRQADQEPHDLVIASHGNLIPEMIDHLALQRVPVEGSGCELGSTWALERDGDRWTSATYLGLGADA